MKGDAVKLAPDRQLSLSALVSVAFFTCCGGAYMLEPLIGAVGPGWGFALLFVIPVLWSIPIALMAAELNGLMPAEGGYYIWVREALGPFWAVQEGWWTIAASVLLTAIFPVMFASYASQLVPGLGAAIDAPVTGPAVRWLVALAVIGAAMAVNWFGVREVGWSSKFAMLVVLGAFAVFVLVWLLNGGQPATALGIIARDLGSEHKAVLLLGLSIGMVNFGGYDNLSTYAAEVINPRRNYPIALAVVIVLTIAAYALPVLAGIAVTTDPKDWTAEAGWPVIASRVGGRWLGGLLAFGGMISMWALFNAQLLYTSRIPYVAARDGWMPKFVARADVTTAAPRASIASICVITAVFAAMPFDSLAIISSIFYAAALALEFVALLVFRVRQPTKERSFRIPGGVVGLVYVCFPPIAAAAAIFATTLSDGDSNGLLIAISAGVVACGLALHVLRRSRVAA